MGGPPLVHFLAKFGQKKMYQGGPCHLYGLCTNPPEVTPPSGTFFLPNFNTKVILRPLVQKKMSKKMYRKWPGTLGHPTPLVHYLGGGDKYMISSRIYDFEIPRI